MLLKVRTAVSLGAGVISNLGEHDSDVSMLIISLSRFGCWWHGSVCEASRSYSLMSSLLNVGYKNSKKVHSGCCMKNWS